MIFAIVGFFFYGLFIVGAFYVYCIFLALQLLCKAQKAQKRQMEAPDNGEPRCTIREYGAEKTKRIIKGC